ncbi:class I SAM-dependent methyltransferase [Serinicoccus chungangensis]|uniref:class I SAM-dependent methyltransferase n=1 Tax=Serinicoccus chungangensis TaxID=767452 RepID=UPI000B321ACC|nr:class I SAM-dependent methyltransferase [Serinicoccus chungangensis]
MVARPVPADWLALRRRADHRAREEARDLLALLTDHLRARGVDETVVVDVGAGTGSNQAWLAPRLPGRQRWLLVDHDADLLELKTAAEAGDRVTTERAVATVEDLPSLVPQDGAVLLTCAALLDLLSEAEIETLAEVVAPEAAPGAAALLSLSVTGEVALTPGHPGDAAVTAAFDAHQRREGRPGPDAAEVMARALRRRGARVELRATDWVLDAADEPLLRRYLEDRAAVAVEHDPGLAPVVREWLQERSHQLETGSLRARVGHLDLLSLPRGADDEGAGAAPRSR